MDHNQHDQQGIYTLHHIAEQAENSDVNPQVVLQHLQATMQQVEVLQQQMTAMAEATSSTSSASVVQEAIQTLAENQTRQQEYQLQVQEILAQLAQRGLNVPVPNALTSKFKGDPNGMSLNQFMSQLDTVFSRHPRSFRTDVDKINLALQSMEGCEG